MNIDKPLGNGRFLIMPPTPNKYINKYLSRSDILILSILHSVSFWIRTVITALIMTTNIYIIFFASNCDCNFGVYILCCKMCQICHENVVCVVSELSMKIMSGTDYLRWWHFICWVPAKYVKTNKPCFLSSFEFHTQFYSSLKYISKVIRKVFFFRIC